MIDLRFGDCLEVMKDIPDGSIDMILCDLPYGTTQNKWDTVISLEALWEQYGRIAKPSTVIALFSTQPFTTTLISSNPSLFKYDLVWEKTMPSGAANSSHMPMRYHESIIIFYDGKATFNKLLAERSEAGKVRAKTPISSSIHLSNYIGDVKKPLPKQYDPNKVNPKSILKFGSVANSKGKLHSAQKPVDLCEYLIKTYTHEGETVMDNCMGSGSTGVACLNTSRRFIGIEKDEKYFEIAKTRLGV